MSDEDGLTPMAVANVLIRGRDGRERRVPVLAQKTATEGLVVTPSIYGNTFTGDWSVTHEATGLAVPIGTWGTLNIDTAVAVADALAGTPVDWTAGHDEVKAQIVANMAAVKEAIHRGQYPPAAPDGEDDPKPDADPAPYPKTDAQATADALARHITRSLQYRCKETWRLVGYDSDDKPAMDLYRHHAAALVAEWALVMLLRSFAKHDQAAADYVARDIWNGWESGDATHELTFEWAKEYGLPEVEDEELVPAAVAADGQPPGGA